MPWASGSFTRTDGTRTGGTIWQQARDAAVKILALDHDTHDEDMATGVNSCLNKDGSNAMTGDFNGGSQKLTLIGAATLRTDAPNTGQVQDGKINWVDGGGTADAITATYSPAITALVDGQECYVRATAANATTTPTFKPNGETAHTIVKTGGVALVAGDIVGDGHELIFRYELANTRWELLNPATSGATAALDNLASVAINTSLISDTDNTDDLGSTSKGWRDVYLRTGKFDGSTSGTTTVQATAVAGSTTLTLPAATDTLVGKATTDTLTNKTIDANGTGNALSNIDIGNAIAASQAEAEAGTDNTKLVTPLRVAEAIAALAASTIVQVVSTQTGAVATGTTTIPYDDTIPQITEGDEYMTLAITPTDSSNKLFIDVVVFYDNSTTLRTIIALFQDSTAGALSAVATTSSTNQAVMVSSFTFEMVAGTTSATTFRVRIGPSAAGTITFNGQTGGRLFGGVAGSSMKITEVLV